MHGGRLCSKEVSVAVLKQIVQADGQFDKGVKYCFIILTQQFSEDDVAQALVESSF